MIVASCISTEPSSTDGGDGIGRLQLLLGSSGSGKSYVLNAAITTLQKLYNWNDTNMIGVFATTGKAATNIGGSTIQNYTTGLGFYSASKVRPLSSTTLKILQTRFADVKLIILDEFSMLKQSELFFVNARLKQIKCNDLPFGGLTILLAGDPGQLPPVLGKCLWHRKSKPQSHNRSGYLLYHMFETGVKLEENARLDHDDKDAVFFDGFLKRLLHDGINTEDDWKTMCAQSHSTMCPHKWKDEFGGDDVMHLYCTNKEVAKRNIQCLKNVGNPIVQINASHTGRGHAATSNQAGGLEKRTYLCEGASVLLTSNIWQIVGLCNGATGTVVDIIYHSDNDAPGVPACVIVDFGNSYKGSRFFKEESDFGEGCIPIFPKTEYWETVNGDKKTTHSRTMIPLRLSYAWTIWKAQGQTIKTKVVIVLGNTEREHGLTYTAFSRVERASDIGIDGGFPRNRLLEKVKKQRLMKERIKEEKRIDREIIVPTVRKLRFLDPIPFWSSTS